MKKIEYDFNDVKNGDYTVNRISSFRNILEQEFSGKRGSVLTCSKNAFDQITMVSGFIKGYNEKESTVYGTLFNNRLKVVIDETLNGFDMMLMEGLNE